MCSRLPCVETRTEVLLIRHVTERLLTSNTGRFVALSLPNCRVVEYGGGAPFDAASLISAGSALLYCSGPAHPLRVRPQRLIVLDGSFRQARRMYKRLPELRELPEFTLPPPLIVPTRLRQPTQPDGMSTIEAVAAALAVLEGPDAAGPLWSLHAELVRRADLLRGRKRAIVPAGP